MVQMTLERQQLAGSCRLASGTPAFHQISPLCRARPNVQQEWGPQPATHFRISYDVAFPVGTCAGRGALLLKRVYWPYNRIQKALQRG